MLIPRTRRQPPRGPALPWLDVKPAGDLDEYELAKHHVAHLRCVAKVCFLSESVTGSSERDRGRRRDAFPSLLAM